MQDWYVDSSVALRILLGHSRSAMKWFDAQGARGGRFISSTLLGLEMTRVLRREAIDTGIADDFIAEFTLLRIDDELMLEAAAIRAHIKSLDAIHLASALRVGVANATVVTHDSAMKNVADGLGFRVMDPVED